MIRRAHSESDGQKLGRPTRWNTGLGSTTTAPSWRSGAAEDACGRSEASDRRSKETKRHYEALGIDIDSGTVVSDGVTSSTTGWLDFW